MSQTLLVIRIFFFTLVVLGSYLLAYAVPEWDDSRWVVVLVGALLGALVILVDLLLKGFSLRGLSAITFGLFIGWVIATFISNSPLFEAGDPAVLFVVRLTLFVVLSYLGAVIALRGKDEFSLVIPYVRFVPQHVESPLAVLDTSALIDGRIVPICESKFMSYSLVVPTFVIEELHKIADSRDPHRKDRGRKGLETLNKLRSMSHVELRIHESDASSPESIDAKLVYVAKSLKARVITTDYNLGQIAQLHGVDWLNFNSLTGALRQDVITGDQIEVSLVKEGRESGQAVGYLADGSMVVVNDARQHIGKTLAVEIVSIVPSAAGKLIFARPVQFLQDFE